MVAFLTSPQKPLPAFLSGWRKSNSWRKELKSMMRDLGRAYKSGGKNKESRTTSAAERYIHKSVLLSSKIKVFAHKKSGQSKNSVRN
jgi:hypothetical protein